MTGREPQWLRGLESHLSMMADQPVPWRYGPPVPFPAAQPANTVPASTASCGRTRSALQMLQEAYQGTVEDGEAREPEGQAAPHYPMMFATLPSRLPINLSDSEFSEHNYESSLSVAYDSYLPEVVLAPPPGHTDILTEDQLAICPPPPGFDDPVQHACAVVHGPPVRVSSSVSFPNQYQTSRVSEIERLCQTLSEGQKGTTELLKVALTTMNKPSAIVVATTGKERWFDGEPDKTYEEATNWLWSYNHSTSALNWTDGLKLEHLRTVLKGTAYRWYQRKFQTWNSWCDFEKEFRSTFCKKAGQAELWAKFTKVTQKPDEPELEYFHRKARLCEQLGLSCDEARREIIEGFRQDQFKNLLKVRYFSDLDAMGDHLRDLCKFESSKATSNPWRDKKNNKPLPSTPDGQKGDENSKKPNKVSNLAFVKCYNCQEFGHYSYHCDNKKVDHVSSPSGTDDGEETTPKMLDSDP